MTKIGDLLKVAKADHLQQKSGDKNTSENNQVQDRQLDTGEKRAIKVKQEQEVKPKRRQDYQRTTGKH